MTLAADGAEVVGIAVCVTTDEMTWIRIPGGARLAVDAETTALPLSSSKTEPEAGARDRKYAHLRFRQRTAFTARYLAAIVA